MGDGAWLFWIVHAICPVISVNERDFSLLNSGTYDSLFAYLLHGLCVSNAMKVEAISGL